MQENSEGGYLQKEFGYYGLPQVTRSGGRKWRQLPLIGVIYVRGGTINQEVEGGILIPPLDPQHPQHLGKYEVKSRSNPQHSRNNPQLEAQHS